MIWILAAFVLGEVWQTESGQTGMGIGIFGIFVLCGIFFTERVSKSQNKRELCLEVCCLFLFFGFGFWRMQTESQESRADLFAFQKESVTVEGTLYKVEKTAYYNRYYLKDIVVICNKEKVKYAGAVQVSVKAAAEEKKTENIKEARLRIGNRVCAKGVIQIPDRASNPGEFDWYFYYRALGIRYQMKSEQIQILEDRIDWIRQGLNRWKEQLKTGYQNICTEKDYGIFCAILLGEKQELDQEVKSLYQENGISHILAISGLHISLIGMGIYHFFRKWFGFLPSQIISGLIMAAYVCMTGSSVSALRAYAMFLLLLTAASLGRTYDIAVAAGWTALFLLIYNPYLIYYAGFLLSFGAIVGIGVIGALLNDYIGSTNPLLKAMISSMSVIWATLPISVYFFFTYAVWSIALNLVIIPCMTLVMLSGIAGGLLGIWIPAAGMLSIGIGHYILCFYEEICRLAAYLPKQQLLIGRPAIWQTGIYYGVVCVVCLWAKRQREKRKQEEMESNGWGLVWKRVLFLGSMMCFLILILCFRRGGRLEVTFLDVSQGDGIFLRLPSGAVCLIDGGSSDIKKVGEYRILPFLQSERIECLDFVFISHVDQDHISGVKEILQSDICRIDTLCLPDIDNADSAYLGLVQMAEEAGSRVVYLKSGDRIEKDELLIRCVHPVGRQVWADRNSYSMVLWLQYGEIDFLFTGDIGEEQEREIRRLLPRKIEVLKVAHHGSQYSSSRDFLEWVCPKYAVISCGDGNSYGHPHIEAVERILESGTEILNTQDGGAIRIFSDGKRLQINQFLK